MEFTNHTIPANTTTAAPVVWTSQLIFQATVLTLSVTANLVVLLDFLRIPARITPFTIYLIALLVANLLFLLPVTFLEILNTAYGGWWMGRRVCQMHNYFNEVWSGAQCLCHVLISVNRLWAVTFSVSYKHHHTKKVAVFSCVAALLWAHMGGLPIFILDTLYYNLDLRFGCHSNFSAMPAWNKVEDWMNHTGPLIFILLSYLYLFTHRLHRKRTRVAVVSTADTRMTIISVAEAAVHKKPVVRREVVKPFMILSLTVVSISVCWIPALVFFSTWFYAGVFLSPTFFVIATGLYAMQALIDPLLFAYALYRRT
ncbi:trace amine-associated receptor 7g-like [Paramacrobiotus metropolitanus]|uniref:trace amine-associated receptor 7g-like n=1 Tax=Paramacrobiotus metropolitanus TaxID=2943436 RepID=UPI00244582F5|nr:trace amine-associated receptor 7g-like [Paramacrobiotus metropolitanus]